MNIAGPLAASLSGIGVLVTRPVEQASRLMLRLSALGARPIAFPALAIVAPGQPEGLYARLAEIEQYDWALFVSPTAVQFGLAALQHAASRNALLQLRIAAVGGGTAAALGAAGILHVVSPVAGADSEHLLAMSEFADLAGQRILIFRGEGGRELIADSLRARGAEVAYAECYRRVCPQTDPAPLHQAIADQRVQAITVFSRETLDHLLELLGPQAIVLDAARELPLFAPHERIAQHAQARGFCHAIATAPGEDGVLAGLVEYFGHD